MIKHIETFLDHTTMYRLLMYVLGGLIAIAALLGLIGWLPYSPLMLAFSTALITAVCLVTNAIFAKIFKAPVNVESLYISALILVLIITPPKTFLDGTFLEIAFWASAIAMASKYILAIGKKHLFNPVALAVAATAFALNNGASWWVGTLSMLPFVTIGGYLIVKKIRRWDLVIACVIAALIAILGARITTPLLLPTMLWKVLIDTPLFFFASVMLTEPLTTPPTKGLRILYGLLTGVLFAPWVHIGSTYFTPELALLAGNVFSYLVSPKQKLLLTLREKVKVAEDVYDFRFTADQKMRFKPGQYLEWTLPHESPDNRGNRRYFTISSSPTERTVDIGVKFYEKSSSYKKKLLSMKRGETLIASQLSGDFTLPRDPSAKLVFVSGGIGVTPFRSMIKYLVDSRQKRDIVHLYANRKEADIAYADVFDQAAKELSIRTIYTLSDRSSVSPTWTGYTGYIDAPMVRTEIPDYRERYFYLSGPRSMILSFEQTLLQMGVHESHIRKDFFPGFA